MKKLVSIVLIMSILLMSYTTVFAASAPIIYRTNIELYPDCITFDVVAYTTAPNTYIKTFKIYVDGVLYKSYTKGTANYTSYSWPVVVDGRQNLVEVYVTDTNGTQSSASWGGY